MLSKKHRLKRGQIKVINKKGESKETSLFIIKVLENTEETPRFSALVSRKVFSKAVKRNHLRRQIYEAIRLNMDIVKTLGKDIILIPKKHITTLRYQEIEKGVCEMLNFISNG